jgi:L,D-peptidoglycan transpeptidase YkuD (ErfK/YbiS/YcfS/YnhG family)
VNACDLVLTPRGVRFMGRLFPCSIGRGGLTSDKHEGDGATPRGNHSIKTLLYRPDRMRAPTRQARPVLPGDLWSDASEDAAYNHPVRAPYEHSHEALRRADPLYDLVLITGWNYPCATPGRGSAIFIHQWRRPGFPTEGCVAFRRDHLLWIAQHLRPGARLIVR